MNMQKMMQEAQKLQRDMEKKQAEIESTEFTGTSEFCDLVIMGDHKIKSINFKIESLDSDDMEALEDMIKIAYNEASKKLESTSEQKLGALSKMGGLF
ncbi:MAG: YbaB/EbfC family nucleoid-associated protein [bacterium]